MDEERATAVADLLLVAAVAGAAWIVLRDPARRRAAFRLTRQWVRGPLASFLKRELRTAWAESGQQSQRSMIGG
jgi:hypothetical protein